ncbi:chromate transporter-domain-containing protein [Aspergillus undulatus]|uniref:chromate transporter-domain-containing protein n=1 Tax=Aspergillus undulatus TaxID=1810928 RepID=UPI003CCD4D57
MLPAIPTHLSSLRSLRRKWQSRAATETENDAAITSSPSTSNNKIRNILLHTWDLGLTAFRGPPVHFQILHERFVVREKWVDEQTQEFFAICQGLPGPGSTKMFFCLALPQGGYIPYLVVLMLWRIDSTLPEPVYTLLSGLNSATVGIFALAAVQLAEKVIRDKISRILVIFGPARDCVIALAEWRWKWGRENEEHDAVEDSQDVERLCVRSGSRTEMVRLRRAEHTATTTPTPAPEGSHDEAAISRGNNEALSQPQQHHAISVRVGAVLSIAFFASFITILTIRARLNSRPLPLNLFANMYLAGTIIFGGGPVVIPLLRSYVVDPGWVSSRDFLIGLALIQAFPGPNFNFAIFLGALAIQHTHQSSPPSILGALLAGLAIFTPGITLSVSIQSFWRVLRRQKPVLDFLRGVNAAAVELVFTAVDRLWGDWPWWLIVAAVTYAQSKWFNVPPAMAILGGAVSGVAWFGAVKA